MQCLDLGSGAGTDVIICGLQVQGLGGKAIGLDILPEMVARAAANAEATDGLQLGTTEFRLANVNEGEIATAFADQSMDVVTSNCCVCLFVQDIVFPTIFNVLKPGGVFCFAESMMGAPFDTNSKIYKLFREAYQKGIYPSGRDASCKGFRASIACTHSNPMTPELVKHTLEAHGFVDVCEVARLKNPMGLSSKPLPMPDLMSDSLSELELAEFHAAFAEEWGTYDIDAHVTYCCVKARRPLNA